MSKIKESFSWLTPEAFKFEDVGKNKVRIKGVALKSGTISRNARKYVQEELVRSARTLVGRPVNVNHNDNKIIGNVEWAEYEGDALEYYAIVNKQPYVEYIRNKDSAIKGVSVQAKYLHNKCPKCGEKFYTEEDFAKHMTEVEHIRNFQSEPHGIIYDALALVVSPEVPGVADTTIELMETLGMSRLLETVTNQITEKIEWRQKMEKIAAVTPEKHVAIGKTKPPTPKPAIKEQEPEKHECGEGEEWNEEKKACVPKRVTEQEEHECPEGEEWNEEQGKCIPKAKPPEEAPPPTEQETKQPLPEIKLAESTPPTSRQIVLREALTTPKLSLAEPCDWSKFGYTSFDDCVASNQDKGDPEAYCGSLKSKEKLEINRHNLLVETTNKILEYMSQPIQVEIPTQDLAWKQQNKQIVEALNKLATAVNNVPLPYNDKPLREAIAKIPKDDLSWKEIPEDDLSWKEQIPELKTLLNTQKKELDERIETQKKDNETILNALDTKYIEYKKTMEDRLKEQEDELKKRQCPVGEHWDEEKGKCAPNEELEEVKQLKAKIAELETKLVDKDQKSLQETEKIETRVDNLEDKIKGQFKGHNKPLALESETTYVDDTKALRETAPKKR